MRVLHLWDSYAPGLFDRSFEICREQEIDRRLICMNLSRRGEAPPADVRWVRDIEGDASATLTARLKRKIRTKVYARRFRKVVREEIKAFAPDLLHLHYGTTGALLVREILACGKPFLVSFYGFDISQGVRDPATRSAYERLFRLKPLVHVLCDEARQRAMSLGAEESSIVDANLPLPIELYPHLGIASSGPYRWLMPARFVEKKGHAVALRAFKSHLADHPDDRLTCWGYGDPGWLIDLVNELQLQSSVAVVHNGGEGEFNGAYLQQLKVHDAILAPSVRAARGDDEGGPALAAVLAQVAGKPVIFSDFPGHERSVTHGAEGLVVPQGDARALADAMTVLSRDRQSAAAMGRAGRARALAAFSEESYRDALLGWYRRLAS